MKKYILSLDEQTHQDLKVKAATEGKNMNDVILKALKKELEKKGDN